MKSIKQGFEQSRALESKENSTDSACCGRCRLKSVHGTYLIGSESDNAVIMVPSTHGTWYIEQADGGKVSILNHVNRDYKVNTSKNEVTLNQAI